MHFQAAGPVIERTRSRGIWCELVCEERTPDGRVFSVEARPLIRRPSADGDEDEDTPEPATLAHDRRHDGAQSVTSHTAIVPLCGGQVQPPFQALSRPAGYRGRTSLSGPPRFTGDILAFPQSDGPRAALFLWRDLELVRDTGTDHLCARTQASSSHPERRRGVAISQGRAEPVRARRVTPKLRTPVPASRQGQLVIPSGSLLRSPIDESCAGIDILA